MDNFETQVNTLSERYVEGVENNLQTIFNEIFSEYYEESIDKLRFFQRFPQDAYLLHEDLCEEFRSNIEPVVKIFVAEQMFGIKKVGEYYDGELRSELYERVCENLCGEFTNRSNSYWMINKFSK